MELEPALSLVRDGRLEEALTAYEELLERAPEHRDARLGRARVLGWLARHDESLAELGDLRARDPNDAEVLVARARVLGWMKRYADAEEEARSALAIAPEYAEARLVLGDLQAWQQSYGEAELSYSEARRLAPEDPRPLLALGRLKLWQGQRADARAAFEEAIRIAPERREPREALERLEVTPRPRRFHLDLGFQYDHLQDGRSDWWREHLTLAFQATERATVHAGFEQYRRFGEDDTQWSLGGSWAAGGWWLGGRLALGMNVDFTSRYAFDLELARRLTGSTVAQLHYRRSYYDGDLQVDAVSPALELSPFEQGRFLARYTLTHLTGGRLGHAGSLRVDLFPGARLSPYLVGAYGTEAFAPSSVEGQRSHARLVSGAAGLVWRVREGVGLRLSYEYENLRNTYERNGLGAGLFATF